MPEESEQSNQNLYKNPWAMPDKWQELTYAFERDAHIALRQGRIDDCLQSCHALLIRIAPLIPEETDDKGKKVEGRETKKYKDIEDKLKRANNLNSNFNGDGRTWKRIYQLTTEGLGDINMLMLKSGVYFPKSADMDNLLFKH